MKRHYLTLQPSEGIVAAAAAQIYAAYVAGGRVPEGSESEWMARSVEQAIAIAKMTDESVVSDNEMD